MAKKPIEKTVTPIVETEEPNAENDGSELFTDEKDPATPFSAEKSILTDGVLKSRH